MILQALKEYYDRQPALAPDGWEKREFPFIVIIDTEGCFVRFEKTQEGSGVTKTFKQYLVPTLGEKKGNGIKANLLWENIEYLFGIPVPTKTKPNPDAKRVRLQHECFRERVNSVSGNCIALVAAKKFVALDHSDVVLRDPLWLEVRELNQSLALSLVAAGPILDDKEVRDAVDKSRLVSVKGVKGLCLITGSTEEITRLEPPIKGVWGAQPMGANIVAVNNKNEGGNNAGATPAFASYGKQQAFNSPIGKSAAFAYTTALNYLLSKDSKQRMQVGDASTVFWSSRETRFESEVADFFSEPPKDDPDRGTRAVESLFKSVQSGAFSVEEKDTKFYVLGLAPNASRIAIRFWIVDTIPGMASKFCQHFEDIKIAHGPRDGDALSLFRLLVSTAVLGKSENIPPNIAGETMRALLEGLPYPQTLLQAVVRRIRAEHEITHPRAALIKACLNRSLRFNNPQKQEEMKVSLDLKNINPGYRLGRLFATLEKIQAEASPGINATIRDKFYGAASSTPVTVFGSLMRLKNHHLAKLENPGRRVNFEKLISEIVEGIADFPAHLTIEDQGRFAIGYYHQMQAFFTKKTE